MPKQKGVTLWFTGLSGSGKTTIAKETEKILTEQGYKVERLDGDEVREYLCRDLGFSREDRDENIRRVSYVARLLTRNNIITLCCFVSPYGKAREEARKLINDFVEIYVNTSLEECERRDVKGLYAKARAGEINMFTGVSDPYEIPINSEVVLNTETKTAIKNAVDIIDYLYNNNYLNCL